MQLLSQLKIGTRLALGFGVLIALLVLLGVGGIYQMRQANAYAHDLGDNWLPTVKKLGQLSNELGADRRTLLRHIIEYDAGPKAEQEALINKRHQEVIPAMLKQYESMLSDPEERRLFDAMQAELKRYYDITATTVRLSNGGASNYEATAAQDKDEGAPAFKKLMAALGKLVEHAEQSGNAAATESTANYHRSIVLAVIAIALAALLGAAFAVLVSRSIIVPLGQGVQLAEAVAAGDLRSDIRVSGKDELADLLRALQNMNHRLVDIVGRVRMSSDSIATGSAEIALGNTDLSHRTEQQASNLEETAASMEELSATVKNNAGLAQEANRLADGATVAAEKGGEVVAQVVHTMQDISASSRKIADIIGVIDGIAFQTNILALNAAVEAARAGEQGRGFAVVAGEVRNLAQRSASAAKEIKTLIDTSVSKVENGTQLVGQAGQNMEGIVGQVRQVRNLISEIANASSEQSSGIEQVGQAVTQLDQVTQQNAALVEESAAAAASLESQAAQLAELVSVFKLSGASAQLAPARVAAPSPAPAPVLHRPAAKSAPAVSRAPAKPAPRLAAASAAPAPAKAPVAAAKPAPSEAEEDWTTF